MQTLFMTFSWGLDVGALAIGVATLVLTLHVVLPQLRASRIDVQMGYQLLLFGFPKDTVVIVPLTMHNPGMLHARVNVADASLQGRQARWVGVSQFLQTDSPVPDPPQPYK